MPFATSALGRLSQLSVWWIKLGITPELIEEVCYVSRNGGVRWRNRWVHVSHVLAEEYVGVADGVWSVYFGPVLLGRFGARNSRIDAAHNRNRL